MARGWLSITIATRTNTSRVPVLTSTVLVVLVVVPVLMPTSSTT